MKRLLKILIITIIAVSCKKDDTLFNTANRTADNLAIESVTEIANNHSIVPAVNAEIFPDINWNDVTQGKNNYSDFNGDKIPDITSYEFTNNSNPPIFKIYDYSGRILFKFDLKAFNKNVKDSFNMISYDIADLNDDGKLDIGLTYGGEWKVANVSQSGSFTIYKGRNSYILINKGNMIFEPTEIIDDSNNAGGMTLFDWDFDGRIDILIGPMQESDYYKNLGNNVFKKAKLNPLFISNMYVKGIDFDKDGRNDFFNLWVNQKDEQNEWISKDFSQTLSVVTSTGVKNFPVIGKIITKYIFITKNIVTAERINMVDGDLDGDLDLIVGSLQVDDDRNWFYLQEYFENTGSRFEYKKDYIEIDKNLLGQLQVWSSDIDKDGDMDLYYPTYDKFKLNKNTGFYFWWENTKTGFKINKNFKLIY